MAGSRVSRTVPRVLACIAEGSEEIEFVSIVDILRRASISVVVAASGSNTQVTCSRGVKIVADTLLADVGMEESFDAIVVPGGAGGAQTLSDDSSLIARLQKQLEAKKWVGAICAAPALVLAHHKLIPEGHKATCYPAPKFQEIVGSSWVDDRVHVEGCIVTSQGPGTAMDFALELIRVLLDKDASDKVRAGLLA